MQKFLIIRFSSIGDIVLTTPVIRCLKLQVPDASIHFLTKSSFASVLQNNKYIDQLWLTNGDLEDVIPMLKDENFTAIFDLHHNLRSLKVKNSLKVPSFAFSKLNYKKWLMVNFKINQLPTQHIVDRYLETTSTFNIKNDHQGLDYFINQTDVIPRDNLPVQHQSGYIALVIGAKHRTKIFPVNKIVELVTQLNYPVVLIGGKEDKERGEEVIQLLNINQQQLIWNTCGLFSLNQSASLIQQAKLVISNDTGLMHIAAAFKKPIISLWGNTIPEFGMTPYEPGFENQISIFENKDLNCRPCSKIGFDQCPKKHFRCMNDLNVSSIANEAKKWIS